MPKTSSKNNKKPSSNVLLSPRAIAAQILSEAESSSVYVDHVMEKHMQRAALPVRDRALVTALVHGVSRWRARLDAEIQQHFRHHYDEAQPFVKNTLRCAVYQMLFMDRIPDYAAVDEAVEMIQLRYGNNFSRLANGVLRNIQRAPMQWPPLESVVAKKELKILSQMLSHPEWLLKRWIEQFGWKETAALAEADNRIPAVTVRIVRPQENLTPWLEQMAGREVKPESIKNVPNFYRLPHLDDVTALPGFAEGWFTVQDPSAGLVAHLAAPQRGEIILDLCAAPGGKALQMAEMVGEGHVVAIDLDFRRLEMLKETAQRLNFSIHAVIADARAFAATPSDLVLVDAPCSGLGVLSRRSDLRWRRRPKDITDLVELQKEILTDAAELVKSGGRLIYSTCTIDPEENEKVVEWFLEHHQEFRLEPAQNFVHKMFCDERGYLRTLQSRHNMDGSFAARLVKS
ncbi:MAG: 16S rRNA (cytosine(967)-C(5))-methyltransferase RsmB [candidate division KSB1 bacterium]|nr:16S rRNA (cytosine(967)-C(5))-methyltransferase RsmB [candidate division KSB1 bacterium]MDZ7368072.1 16S rRNA (cytosine(967)-C(5))-methyltransferase RsmB [candidate division KSB1 bacterium]MDZ7405702.1 16S rRNA (cytosine(967)-C(5))-methyltransferase RsmB [candidate division KSB1 bacterium]